MRKFSLRTLLLTATLICTALAVALWALDYRHFCAAKRQTLEGVGYIDNANQRNAIENAVLRMKFKSRHDTVLVFAGLHTQSDGRIALFADWVSMRLNVDSIRIQFRGGDSTIVKLDGSRVITDDNMRYHYAIYLDTLGLPDGAEIEGVTLFGDNQSLSGPIAPQQWKLDWLEDAG